MSPYLLLFFLFSCYITSSSNITNVYSMEHIPEVKNMSTRKFNVPLTYVHMFDDPLFLQPQYFECKQADYRIDK